MTSKANLHAASHQWATRPDDERFETIEAMTNACRAYAMSARTASVTVDALEVGSIDNDVVIRNREKQGQGAALTHYAFGQLSRLASAPPEYLRSLPAPLAASCLAQGLATAERDRLSVLFAKPSDGGYMTRAVTSEMYDRVWNYQVLEAMTPRLEGWRVPPARPSPKSVKGVRLATEADVLSANGGGGLAIRVGDPIAPAGLYASDHDMFAFLVKQGVAVEGSQAPLNFGVFIQNSEVGDCALKFKTFLYDAVCGNHIVWGVSNVQEVSVRHVKGASVSVGRTLANARAQWSALTATPDLLRLERSIDAAKGKVLGATDNDAMESVKVFAKRKGLSAVTNTRIEDAFAVAQRTPRYGNPRTVWAMVNGLTELSQGAYADKRTDLDTQAGRLMELAF